MSMMSKAIHDSAVSSKKAGGSFATQQNRRFDTTGLLRFARQVGELHSSISEIPAWEIHAYAQYCAAQGKATGTLANIFAAIRVTSRYAGRNIDAVCSNKELQLVRRVRKGTKRAMTPREIEALFVRAKRIDHGLTHMISLALHLGLRRKEALMCPPDLRMWLDALERGDSTISLMRGSKNARPRQVRVIESERAQTTESVRSALAYCREHNLELITGNGKTLKSAMNRLKALLRRAGVTGPTSFHSLRYTYALKSALELLEAGVPPYDVLVQLSESLGHGPTRAQMILGHYCQSIRDKFEGQISRYNVKDERRPPAELPRAAARQVAKRRHSALSGYPIGRAGPADDETALHGRTSVEKCLIKS
ncbi:integrase domain-containing protein [Paraburkholderia madseniana]|uniref:Integrase domain-containing protein n=1 Tax=Paraburkholderia madseniana TaxID=2599607 RepID=A0AAP5BHW5_9BURK|nr:MULTISPECIES: integrase domain-containing protein [Paraburkholderia]MCX4149028.1 integrase domain-containing protein [Paraburkholderia madseniana]MDN7151965.1 integrase domain-containing protein [Paraburkholderia sp. WS6]MDQ6410845.1 integrase domain-containing protein [Paraburkholderia madseniana]